jgi:hypothetical protein
MNSMQAIMPFRNNARFTIARFPLEFVLLENLRGSNTASVEAGSYFGINFYSAGKAGAIGECDFNNGALAGVPVEAKPANRLARELGALDVFVLHEFSPQP